MLSFDLTKLLEDKLSRDSRPGDGKLHPSSDLLGSLRHSQLRAAGAPTVDGDIVSAVRLMTGTQWHKYFETLFEGMPVMTEVKLDRWMPEGWSGTADWVIWNDELEGFVLGDLKTIKGEGIKWIERSGIKEEHQWQISSYWHALYAAGFPMVKGYVVLYLPMNQVVEKGKFADVHPVVMEGIPLPEDTILPVMKQRWTWTVDYLRSVKEQGTVNSTKLAPVQGRIQKLMKSRDKPGQTDVVLVPHWSTSYCPFPDELCDCNTQGTTKIGHYISGEYTPRKGYEDISPIPCPS